MIASLWTMYVVFLPQNVQFSFAQTKSCRLSPALLPGLVHDKSGSVFAMSRPASISLGRLAVYSNRLCARPLASPRSKAAYIATQNTGLGLLELHKTVHIRTGSYAVIKPSSLVDQQSQTLPILAPLNFTMSQPDTIYSYVLMSNGNRSICQKAQLSIRCDPRLLQLKYGTHYTLLLQREFNNLPVGRVLTKDVTTITAASIIQTSIAANATVFDRPQQISFQVSKPLTSVGNVSLSYSLDNKLTTVPVSVSFKDSTVTVNYTDVLPRQTVMTAHISNLTATDHSQLAAPYDLVFTTSGGPKVMGVSIASSDVTAGSFSLAFDQPLLPNQTLDQFVSLTVNGAGQAVTYAMHGSTITITPKTTLPLCAHLVISTTNQLQSQYGISGNSAWSFKSRTRCYTTFSIGTSVQGRALSGYKFGNGPTEVLYIGAMHGNESNTSVLLQKWISALKSNPDRVPANRTITVIPAINPDGVAANGRRNAHNIDLNRNFPAADWQTIVTEPDSNGQPTSDGGPTALSEPESQALANYVQSARPRLVLTYHSHAGVVEANDAGDSDALGASYAKTSGYRAIPTYAIGNTFDYSTSGAFEDWANQKLTIPVLVVELTSKTDDEFTRNQAAMWASVSQ